MMNKTKRGLAARWVVIVILLVTGFVIIMFAIYKFNIGERVNRETCHQSVIFRATASSLTKGLAEDYVGLKCKTAKFCITSGLVGGKCDEKGQSFAGEPGITKIKVGRGRDGKEDVEQFIAREVLDCWKMMGEGKVSLFSQFVADNFGVGEVYPTCVICSRIAFDEKALDKASINFKELNMMAYMMGHKAPGYDVDYYELLSQGGSGVSLPDEEFNIKTIEAEISKDIEIETSEGKKTIKAGDIQKDLSGLEFKKWTEENKNLDSKKELAVIFMQISAPDHGEAIKNVLGVLTLSYGAGFVLAPTLAAASVSKLPWIAGLLVVAGIYQQVNIAYNQAITAGYCGDIKVGGGGRGGCSVIRTVNYDVDEISRYCKVIESTP